MKISFDLDDTIIPGTKTFETEPQRFIHRLLGIEKIRKGTIELFRTLKDENHNIGIYTTSFRSFIKIKLTFLLYGCAVDFIINQQKHTQAMRKNQKQASKYPPIFGIDIHVDDSLGVAMEGNEYNFQTIIVGENQENWTDYIKIGIQKNPKS